MADGYISQIKTPDNKVYLLKDSESIRRNSELLTTNPFAPASLRGPYISKIDNAFYAADKRWSVTGTNISSIANLFDGSYESQAVINSGNTAVITMDFDPSHNTISEKNKYFPGDPYGYILISFYNTSAPDSISGKVYCNYQQHGIGWKNITFSPINDNTTSAIVYKSSHQGYYQISVIEITINARSSANTIVTQIEMHLDRPDSHRTPFLSKYGEETLYYNLTAPKFIGALEGIADKSKAANLTTTANAIAYYTNTTGTFGSKASANGALYATSANGALQWGTLPIAQGGTGKTTANDAANALISSLPTWTASPTADTYFIRRDTGGTSTFGQVKFSSIANITNGKITLGPYSITPVTSVNGHTGSSVSVTASDLGLASALKYVGTKSSLPTATDSTTYSTYNNGDVITVSAKEYAYIKGSNAAGSSWVELGDEGSYKLRQTAFTNSTGTADGSNTSITFIYSFSQDENGTITNIKTRSLPTATSTDAGIVKVGTSGGAAAYSHTHSYLANTNIGAADRPIYITGNAAAQTIYRMAGTNTTATTGITYSGDLDTGIWYVNGISGTDKTTLYNQTDGVIIANKYSNNWIGEIYQDYRTGQLAIRGKNNGTWVDWRHVLDSTNYTDYAVAKTAGVTAVTWDATNKKLTSTINDTTVDVMTAAQISTALELGTIASKAENNYMKFGGDDTHLGSGSPAATAKTYWADTTKVSDNMITGYYNHSGIEYSLLFSKRSNYGSILKWGYGDKYLRILRVQGGSWKSTDWEKISAGYADTAPWSGISSKPTTISGYGITDAKIASGVITLGSNTITPVTSVNGHTGKSVNVTAADLGLSNALHFIGITSTELVDGSTTATLTAKSTNSLSKTTGFVDGDVVMDGDQLREYVWSGDAWRLLGITTSSVYTQPASTATNTWIAQISQGTDGRITATTGSLDTSGTWSGNAATATSSKALANYYTDRPENANITHVNNGSVVHFKATSTMTSNKPMGDGNILHFHWDTSAAWDSQLYIPNSSGHSMQWRGSSTAGTWDSWRTLLDSDNYTTYTVTKTGTGASGTWGISITGTAANVTGTVAIDHGGTGATSAADARTNLNTVTGNARVFYGTCATTAATTLKEVICAEYDKVLTIGDMLIVKFDNTNSGAVGSLQITVKNSTSDSAGTTAKNIKRQYNSTGANNLVATGELNKDSIAVFVYNGTYWILTNADYNNTYSYDWTTGAGGNGRTAETAANGGVGIHRYSLQMMTLNLTWSSLSSDYPTAATTNGAATDKTVATCSFLLDSPIIYQDTNANATPGNSANVNGFTTGAINLQYSTTNAQWSALTIQKPVYLIGTLQSDGTFKLNATKWWTQTLPTSDDGQIYIFLGLAYSATNIYLHDAHPIYWYKNGEIQPYAGYATATSRAAITTTANAVAYYTNTTGTFGSKASANGALYATSANGALQWGTLPIAQGGTGVTSFTKNHVILSDNTNGTTGLTSRAYSDSTSAGALSNTSTNFVTERDVYFGLPTLNNAHNYASSSTYYAPTTGGTAGHILIGAGATTAPAWYGGTVMSGTAAASWITAFNGTTDATATNAAAVTIAGGLGIAKKLHVGDTATVPDLTIGSTNEYGDAYTPIYWHEGVPTTVTLVQQCGFTIKSGKSGVKLSHAAITANSYVTEIVITSGESKLNSAISWTSASGYIELTCSSTVSGDVTGYIMISRGGEITATATDIT